MKDEFAKDAIFNPDNAIMVAAADDGLVVDVSGSLTKLKERNGISLTNAGGVIVSPPNICAILKEAGLGGSFAESAVTGRLYVKENEAFRPYRETDSLELAAPLEKALGRSVNKNCIFDAIRLIAKDNDYNPQRAALEALPEWDGVKRAGLLACRYLGAERTEYNKAAERLIISGIIERAYNPGCKFDYMLVLAGGQGIGKSTFCRYLAPSDELYTDSVFKLDPKSSGEITLDKSVVEFSELSALRKYDNEDVKSFIPRQYDEYRPAYERQSIRCPRAFVLTSTTNHSEFLTDQTGNRRFLIIRCLNTGKADWVETDSARNDFRQALAEMLAERERLGGSLPLMLSEDMREAAEYEQNKALEEDYIASKIQEYLDGQPLGEVLNATAVIDALKDNLPASMARGLTSKKVKDVLANAENAEKWADTGRKQRKGRRLKSSFTKVKR